MKKIIILMLIAFNGAAQYDTMYVVKSVDDMTDKTYFYPNKRLLVYEADKSKGLMIDVFFSEDGLVMEDLYIKAVGFSGCSENDEVIMMFEDQSKHTMKSYKQYNCEGKAYFKLGNDILTAMKDKKLVKIRFTNGRSFESYTKEVPEKSQQYFIKLSKALETKDVRTEKTN